MAMMVPITRSQMIGVGLHWGVGEVRDLHKSQEAYNPRSLQWSQFVIQTISNLTKS